MPPEDGKGNGLENLGRASVSALRPVYIVKSEVYREANVRAISNFLHPAELHGRKGEQENLARGQYEESPENREIHGFFNSISEFLILQQLSPWQISSTAGRPSACSFPTPGRSRQPSAPSPVTAAPWSIRLGSSPSSVHCTRPSAWRQRCLPLLPILQFNLAQCNMP